MNNILFIMGGMLAVEGVYRWGLQGFSSAALLLVLAAVLIFVARVAKF